MQPLSLFKVLAGTALVSTVLGAAVPQDPDAGALWQPAVGSTYQIILTNALSLSSGQLTPDVDIYDLDLFDTDASIISGLHAKGKKVICYFSGMFSVCHKFTPDGTDAVQLARRKIGVRIGRRFPNRTKALACPPGPVRDGSMSTARRFGPSCPSGLRSPLRRDVMPLIPTIWVRKLISKVLSPKC
jgi:hypothetical protein